jgi:hypothetical protein
MFDWSRFFAELRNEVQEENDMLKAIQKESGGAVYATDGIYKWGIPSDTLWTEMKAKNLIAPGLTKVSQFLFDRIKDRPATVGSGLSAAQLRYNRTMSRVVYCDNCEEWFCLTCDEEGVRCRCGRHYCGPCKRQGVVCCPLKEDE